MRVVSLRTPNFSQQAFACAAEAFEWPVLYVLCHHLGPRSTTIVHSPIPGRYGCPLHVPSSQLEYVEEEDVPLDEDDLEDLADGGFGSSGDDDDDGSGSDDAGVSGSSSGDDGADDDGAERRLTRGAAARRTATAAGAGGARKRAAGAPPLAPPQQRRRRGARGQLELEYEEEREAPLSAQARH